MTRDRVVLEAIRVSGQEPKPRTRERGFIDTIKYPPYRACSWDKWPRSRINWLFLSPGADRMVLRIAWQGRNLSL